MSSITPTEASGNFLIPASRVSYSETVQTTDRTQIEASIQTTTVTATDTVTGTPVTVGGQITVTTASSSPSQTSSPGRLTVGTIIGLGVGLPICALALIVAYLMFRRNLRKKREAITLERKMLTIDQKEFENLRLGRVKGEEALVSPYTEDTSSTLWEQRTHKTARRDLQRSGDRPAPVKSIFKDPARRLLRPLPSLSEDGESILSERTEDWKARTEVEQRRREFHEQEVRENETMKDLRRKPRFKDSVSSPVSWTSTQDTIVPSLKYDNEPFRDTSTYMPATITSCSHKNTRELLPEPSSPIYGIGYQDLRPEALLNPKRRRQQAAIEEHSRQTHILAPSEAQIKADQQHRLHNRSEDVEYRPSEVSEQSDLMDRTSHRFFGNAFAESFQNRSSFQNKSVDRGSIADGFGAQGVSRANEEREMKGSRLLPRIEIVHASPEFSQFSEDQSSGFSVPVFLESSFTEKARPKQSSRNILGAADMEAEAEADLQIEEARARRLNLLIANPQTGIDKASGVTSFASSAAFAPRSEDEDTSTTELTIGRDPFRQTK